MRYRLITALMTGILVLGTGIANAKTVINVAYENNPGEPVDKVVKYWAELLKEKSKGEVELVAFPSSQLGTKKDVTEQAMMGVNVITITDVGFLQDYDPDLGILFGPYLTDDPAKLFKIYEGAWYKAKEEALKKKGIHVVMTNYLYGVRHVLAKKPIHTPADTKGMKIRAPNQVMLIKTVESMGATATPLPLGEVYPALTQGLVDGVENPIPVLYGGKFHEQAKYLSLVGHLTNTSLWVGGEAFFKTLPADQVKLIHETARAAGEYSQKIAAEQDAEYLEKMKAAGVIVVQPNVALFREAAMSVYKQFPKWTPGLYETIQKELK
jgi:tripartite ATP-independent transporter DctP family solute receptor